MALSTLPQAPSQKPSQVLMALGTTPALPHISFEPNRRQQTPSHKHSQVHLPVWASAVAGAIGNAFSRTAIAPLERTRMQMIADPGRYSTMSSCLRDVWQHEGIRGLWRGNTLNVARIAPQGAIAFYAKDYFKKLFQGVNSRATPLQTLGASMASGICCQTAVYPLDVIRTRLTTTPHLYTGLLNGLKTIVAKEGSGALFKGLLAANFFAVPYYGTQFFSYDMMKQCYATAGMPAGEQRAVSPLLGIPLGSVSACLACAVAFPLQMVWKRLQVQGTGGRPVLYRGICDCMIQVTRSEGMRGVYAGLPANLVKLAPTGALTFLCVEAVKDAMACYTTD